jgi:hypothetical protein
VDEFIMSLYVSTVAMSYRSTILVVHYFNIISHGKISLTYGERHDKLIHRRLSPFCVLCFISWLMKSILIWPTSMIPCWSHYSYSSWSCFRGFWLYLFSSLLQFLWEQGTTFFVLLVPHSWTHMFVVIYRHVFNISSLWLSHLLIWDQMVHITQ